MPEIVHQFPINAPLQRVFESISTSAGLDAWWTLRSSGQPQQGAVYELCFGDGYDWRGAVSICKPYTAFELIMTVADSDWLNSRVTYLLSETNGQTKVRFCHSGWPEANDHYEGSSFCWAMYLRLLKRHVEFGEVVPYADRLDV